jgi:glucose/arabinose dehydrogenase
VLRTILPRSGALVALMLVASACRDASVPTADDVAADEPTVERLHTPHPRLQFRPTSPFNVPLPHGYRVEALASGIEMPSAVASTPDGRVLIAEQTTGRVRIFRDGVLLDEPWIEVPVSYARETVLNELGLVGVEVDPRFDDNGYVYLYYTTDGAAGTRRTVLTRFRDVDGRGAEPFTLLEIDRTSERSHVAGGMTFLSDALLVGIGDHEDADLAQRLDELPGSILRIDRDGSPLPDNPFVGREDADARVYVYGVRNPFGLTTNLRTGQVYFTDNRDAVGDAVYELRAGEDYGWPYEPLVLVEPVVVYEQPMGIAGAVFYDRDELSELKDSLLYCSFHFGGMLHWSDVTPGLYGYDLVRRDRVIATGCSSNLTVGADGFVYFLSYGSGQLLRISRVP